MIRREVIGALDALAGVIEPSQEERREHARPFSDGVAEQPQQLNGGNTYALAE
jgi:hypothetical protein